MNDSHSPKPTGSVLQHFHGPQVWGGIILTLAGYLCEEFVGSEHAFEILMFFGGLNLGIGLGMNMVRAKAA